MVFNFSVLYETKLLLYRKPTIIILRFYPPETGRGRRGLNEIGTEIGSEIGTEIGTEIAIGTEGGGTRTGTEVGHMTIGGNIGKKEKEEKGPSILSA